MLVAPTTPAEVGGTAPATELPPAEVLVLPEVVELLADVVLLSVCAVAPWRCGVDAGTEGCAASPVGAGQIARGQEFGALAGSVAFEIGSGGVGNCSW